VEIDVIFLWSCKQFPLSLLNNVQLDWKIKYFSIQKTERSGMGVSRKSKLDIQINILKNWFPL
jgi:hypothetical protein